MRPTPDGEVVPLPPPPDGWFEYRCSILMDGALALVRANRDINTAWRVARMSGAPSGLDFNERNTRLRLSAFDGVNEYGVVETPYSIHPEVSRTNDGRWLIAEARAPKGHANGRLLNEAGAETGRLRFGDGIEHLRCAPDGSIWVGYFDEAIGSGDLGDAGLARFTPDGTRAYSHNVSREFWALDVYAMSLDRDDLWSCYYTDFPIIRIRDGVPRVWENDAIDGARAIAVERDHVLLAGGYGEQAGRIALLRLGEQAASALGETLMPEASPFGREMFGHGNTLHIVEHGLWRRITVADMRTALRI